jgi:hypothetical protein
LISLGLRKPAPVACQPPAKQIPWDEIDVGKLPGVITGPNLNQVIAQVQRSAMNIQQTRDNNRLSDRCSQSAECSASPRLVNSLASYNIVEYEGWFYGLPQALGDIHLEEVDVLEMPGVIRDLSQEVVEGEIREMVS